MDQTMVNNNGILEKVEKLGVTYEKECTGCAQTVIAAIFEALDIWSDDVFNAASGLADGLGLTGDGSCGALLGASMVIGYLFPRERKDFKDMYKSMKSYGLVKNVHSLFIREYGSCRCNDVQKGLMGVTWNVWDLGNLNEETRNEMVDHCSKLVGKVAKIATKIILENGFEHKT